MIESMAKQLNDRGVSSDEVDIVTKIIVTLSPSYKHIISVWDNMDDSKKTLQSLRSRLFKKDARNKGCQEEDGVNAAFFAKKQEMPSQQSTYPQSSAACLPSQPPAQHSFGRGRGFRRRNCNYCGGKNHWERQCWTKKDHIENGIPNGSQLLQAQFAQFKPQRQSEITLSLLSQVVLNLKIILRTTGMWTLVVLFICRISFIYLQIIKRLRVEVGQ